MHTITFTEEFITPAHLSKRMGIPAQDIVATLRANKEKSLFSLPVTKGSILPWGAVERFCKTQGYAAADRWEGTPKCDLTKEEKLVLTQAAAFEKAYALSLKEHLGKTDPEKAQSAFEHHSTNAKIIEDILKKTEKIKRPLESEPEIG
jgi:hypothetical protein